MIRAAALLNFRHLRKQRLRTALAVVAVAAGVSLLTAVLVVSQSISASAASYSKALAGEAPLRVEGADDHGGITEATVAKIRATPGVAAAVPVVVAVTTVDTTSHGPLLVAAVGVDCSIEALVGNFGCSSSAVTNASPSSPPLVAPSLLSEVGPGAVVHTDVNLIPLAGAATLGQLDSFNQGRVLVFPLPEAQTVFARPGQVDEVYVKPGPGVAVPALATQLRKAVGPQNPVIAAADPPAQAQQAAAGFVPLLGLLGLAALAMGAILVANILNLSLAERRRELAVASALGAKRATVIGGILLEAAALGAAGGVLGTLVGAGLGHALVSSISNTVLRVAGVSLATTVRPATVILTIGLAILIAVASAARPAGRATSVDLAAELSERREPAVAAGSLRGRALVFTGVGLTGVAMTWVSQLRGSLHTWQPLVGEAGVLLAAVGLITAVGAWTPLILAQVKRIVNQRTGAVAVAVSGLASEPGRTTGMAVAVATAVALGTGLAGMVPTLHSALGDSFGLISGERVYVSTVPINNGSETESKLSPTQLARLSRLPGVAAVGADYYLSLNTSGLVGLSTYSMPPGSDPFVRFAGGAPSEVLASGQAMVGASLARVEHVQAGSILSLPSPSGMVPLRVGGIWEDANNNGLDVMVSQATMLAHWGPLPPNEVYLTPEPTVSTQTLAGRVAAAGLGPDVHAEDPGGYLSQFTDLVDQQVQPFWVLQRALLGLALLATLSTLLLVGVQRRREMGLLGALGLGPAGLARMTLAEAGCIGLVASLLGVGVGLGISISLRDAAGYLFGLEPPLVLSGIVLPAALYCLIALLAVIVGAGLPAWRTAQLQVTEALRYE